MAASKKRRGLYLSKGSVPANLEKEIRDVADAMNTTPDRVIGQLLKDHESKVAVDMLAITKRQLQAAAPDDVTLGVDQEPGLLD